MEQIHKFKFKVRGAKGSDLFDCAKLAGSAWGRMADRRDSALTAFAYLWRRFGPPWLGTDPHKRLVSYILTTSDPQVFLNIDLGGGAIRYGVGYFVAQSLEDEFHLPRMKWEEEFLKWFNKSGGKQSEYYAWRCARAKITEAEKTIGDFPLAPLAENWRRGPDVMKRANQALLDAMKELLRPVYIRDIPINLFGGYDGDDMDAAEPSIYAGYGIPFAAMSRLAKKK